MRVPSGAVTQVYLDVILGTYPVGRSQPAVLAQDNTSSGAAHLHNPGF
jgi:hypothetical protein